MSVSPEKLEELFKEWKSIKKQMSELETRETEIKDLIKDLMREVRSDRLKGLKYVVEQKSQSRTTMSKKDVPEDIWEKYSKTSTCKVLYLKRLDD